MEIGGQQEQEDSGNELEERGHVHGDGTYMERDMGLGHSQQWL